MPFKPFNVPLNTGINESTTNFNVDNPSLLSNASNFMFTKQGSLTGRVGIVKDTDVVQSTTSGGLGATQGGTMASNTLLLAPVGMEANDQGIFAMYQGKGFIKTNALYNSTSPWKESGPFWSTKKLVSPALDYFPISYTNGIEYGNATIDSTGKASSVASPVAVGNRVVAVDTTTSAAHGFSVTNNEFTDLLDTNPYTTSNFGPAGKCNVCVCNVQGDDIIVSPSSLNPVPLTNATLLYHKVNQTTIPGAGTQVTIPGINNVRVSNAGQQIWAVAGSPNLPEMFIAYHTTNNSIIVTRIDTSTGTSTATVAVSGAITGSDLGLSLCHNGGAPSSGGQLCVGYNDTVLNSYVTKIINVTSTTSLTNAGLAINHGVGQEATPPYRPHTLGTINVSGTLKIVVCYITGTNGNRRMNIDLRDFSSTTVTTLYTLWNASDGTSTDLYTQTEYIPFIGATTLNNRVLVGIYKDTNTRLARTSTNYINPSSQWIIVDITNNVGGFVFGNQPIVVASSPLLDVYLTPPINPVIGTNEYKFGVRQGILFDAKGIAATAARVIKLQTVGSRGISVNSATVFTGTTPYMFDGVQTAPLGFVEEAPVITGITIKPFTLFDNQGTGSFTLQAIWQILNGKGQIVRSAQSNIATTSRALSNEAMDVTVSVPQLSGRFLSAGYNVQVKLYITAPNPPANAPLFQVSQTAAGNLQRPLGQPIVLSPSTLNGSPTAGTVTFTNIGTADTSQEQLYVGGGVFDEQMPRSADRGIAFVNNRLWVADQTKVYVSKILNSQYSTAFNLKSGKLIIEMPTSIGSIQALGNLQDKVAVIGSLGCAFIYGVGFDDIGNGTGWAVQVVPSQGAVFYNNNITGPRVATDVPGYGTVFIGPGAVPYLMDYSGTTKAITNSFIDEYLETFECHYWGPGQINKPNSQEHGPMILFGNTGNYRVFDINSSRWATWNGITLGNNQFLSSFDGKLYLQVDDGSAIYSFTSLAGHDDDIGDIICSLATNPISVTGATGEQAVDYAWGRLRSITLLSSSRNLQPYTIHVQVMADNTLSPLIDKIFTVTPSQTAKWPYLNSDEIRATIQRCSRFVIMISLTPAIVELAGIECWVWASDDRAPARVRR